MPDLITPGSRAGNLREIRDWVATSQGVPAPVELTEILNAVDVKHDECPECGRAVTAAERWA